MEINISNKSRVVRKANVSDAEQIAKLSCLCFPEHFSLTPESIGHIIEDHPETSLLVAEWDDRLVGYIFAIPQDGSTDAVTFQVGEACVAQIAVLAVHPDFRGRGIGSALIDAAISAAAQFPGCRRIIAETNPDNVAAQSALLKAGFTSLNRLNAYYPDQVDAIRFDRPLVLRLQPELAAARPAPR
jgi:ribosomal protein S18 acetylase RimI-like enzyme